MDKLQIHLHKPIHQTKHAYYMIILSSKTALLWFIFSLV